MCCTKYSPKKTTRTTPASGAGSPDPESRPLECGLRAVSITSKLRLPSWSLLLPFRSLLPLLVQGQVLRNYGVILFEANLVRMDAETGSGTANSTY